MRTEKHFARLAILLILSTASSGSAIAKETHTLRSQRDRDAQDRVEVTLEVGGQLKVADARDPEGTKGTPLKISAEANLTYDEKSLGTIKGSEPTLRSIRFYDRAEATIRVADEPARSVLRDPRRLIGVEVTGVKATLYSPTGLLTREELDLVAAPGNSLVLDRLLPEKPVAVGDMWKHPNDLLAVLCGLDALRVNEVQSALIEVTDGVARLEMAGRVEGEVYGLASAIEIKAKYRFDLKAKRIVWLGMALKEVRRAGVAAPGLDVVARLQMKISTGQNSSRLTAAALQGVALEPRTELEQLAYVAPGRGWQFAHDRRWLVISETDDSVVLRMIDRGEYVAQCNVAESAARDGKSLPTLAEFQDDIRAGLAKNFGKFLRASEFDRETGERMYRVEVAGEAGEMPIQWIYYLLGNTQGRRVVVAFTIKADQLERFEDVDRTVVSTLYLNTPSVARR